MHVGQLFVFHDCSQFSVVLVDFLEDAFDGVGDFDLPFLVVFFVSREHCRPGDAHQESSPL